MKDAVIFDMDGVIIDSNPYHKISWERFLIKNGYPFNDDIFDNIISGRTGGTSLRMLLAENIPEEIVAKYLMEIDEEFQEILRNAKDVGPAPGLPEFLDTIKNAGFKTALATSAPPGNVELTLDKTNLREYFDLILDKTDVTNGKPNPEVYLNTVSLLGVEKDRCVVFEDSRAGIKSAISAGLRVIGVTTSHSRNELLEEGVSMVIDDFQNLQLEEVMKFSSELRLKEMLHSSCKK